MSKVLRTVGKVAGIVATVAAFIPGGQPVAAIASAVAVTANIGAELTAKKPPARGSVNGITIGTDAPMPVPLGRTYYGGTRQYQTGYGPTKDKVENPYAFIVDVYSGVTIAGFQGFFADFASLGIAPAGGPAQGYAGGFLWADAQRGLTPEPRALLPHWSGAPNWSASSKLSGEGAVGWSLLFDRKGKVFASGVPQLGVTLNGALGYDARRDSTYEGGAGSHRIADETTREWSDDPGVMALTYVLGWRQNGIKVAGIGIPADGIVIADFVHLSNVCQANSWKVGGVVFEPALSTPSTRWQNLKDILAAGGAEPCFKGGRLGLKLSAPQIALDTISASDLADGEITIGAMQGWEGRLNTIIPKYRSEPHKWEYVQSTPVTIASYVTQDGEVKREERQFNLVQDKDQAAQLAAYELLDRRELGEIELRCKPRLRTYDPGDLLIVDIPEAGLVQQPCLVLKRSVDAASMTVNFTLRGETAAKHAFALGQTGIAPPTPSIRTTAELDGVAAPVDVSRASYTLRAQTVAYPVTSDDDSIMVETFQGTLDDGRIITFPAATIEGLTPAMAYVLLYDLAAGTYLAVAEPATAEIASPAYVQIRFVLTSDGGVYPATPTPPGGDGGGGGGSGCPIVTAQILLANADRTGPGQTIAVGDIEAGHWVWAQREAEAGSTTWGAYLVTFTRVFESDLCEVVGKPLSSPSHLWWTSEGWARSDVLGTPAGRGKVVALTVAEAHTYALVGDQGERMLSHNKIAQQNDA